MGFNVAGPFVVSDESGVTCLTCTVLRLGEMGSARGEEAVQLDTTPSAA